MLDFAGHERFLFSSFMKGTCDPTATVQCVKHIQYSILPLPVHRMETNTHCTECSHTITTKKKCDSCEETALATIDGGN